MKHLWWYFLQIVYKLERTGPNVFKNFRQIYLRLIIYGSQIYCFLRTLCDDWRLNLIQRDTCYFCKAKKKSFLFSGNRPRENFLSPTRPHKSNVFENIYFLFQKTHTQTNKILLANSFVQIYVFFPFKQ